MNIQQSPASLSLLGNMLHLVVSSDADVTMTLNLADELLVAHTYSPDSNGLIDVDLHDICAAHLTLTLQNATQPYRQDRIVRQFNGTLVCGEQTRQFGFTVIRAGVDQLAVAPSTFLMQNFLTWQPTVKPVTYYTPEFLTYYAQTPCTVKCTAYNADGEGALFTLGSLSAGGCHTIPTGYAIIAGLANFLPSYYDVWIENLNGNRLTYIQRYYASDIKSEEEEWVLFENSLGGIDTFRAYGDSENTAEHNHHVAEIEEENVEYRVDTERKHKKSTGLLGKYERLWLLDFFPSRGKYIYTGQSIRRIVVTDSEVSYNAKVLPSEYTFTYKYAETSPYLNIPRADVNLQDLHIEVPDIGSFTIAPRLAEFPSLELSDGALFPIQDPYSESWGVTTLASLLQYLLGHIGFDDKYLSRINDDTAEGIITFLKGLLIGDGTHGIDFNGATHLLSIVFDTLLSSKDARRGFTDGKGIWMDAAAGIIQTEGLEVTGWMRVMELIINRLQLMESDYSFTEGDTVEHIDYEDNGQTLVLTMHKDHDNDYTPFYPGDIVYGILNDLLPQGNEIPDGHTATRNGSYFKTWMRVKSVDLTTNKIRVALYPGIKPNGQPLVPGGSNFSPRGTQLRDTDITSEMLAEYETRIDPENPESPTLGESGYDTMLTLTRHGNVADGIDPETGNPSASILASQKERQQAWVLSTTDKRLSFFWNVDEPIVHDENYALCLGILPDLANLPSTRNKAMPSLYVNTVFADHYDKANYPARIVKEDRGPWTANPMVEYTGPDGTCIPDGTLDGSDPELGSYAAYITAISSYAGVYRTGDQIADPYHYRTFNMNTWLTFRLDTARYRSFTDKQLLLKMLLEWRESIDLEVDRVWKGGKIWECLVDGTKEEPGFWSINWMVIGGNLELVGQIESSNGKSFHNGNVDSTLTMMVWWGDEDITEQVIERGGTFSWSRRTAYDSETEQFVQQSEDLDWEPAVTAVNKIHLQRRDMGPGWMIDYRQAMICCNVTFPDGQGGFSAYAEYIY